MLYNTALNLNEFLAAQEVLVKGENSLATAVHSLQN